MNDIKMLHYETIDVFNGIDTSESKECDLFHYWYFLGRIWYLLDKEFKFQLYVRGDCPGALTMSMKLSHIAILNIHGVHYRCIISRVSKSDAVSLL